MIFYLSGSPERFLELRRYRDDLVGLGHEVSSRWLQQPVSEQRNVDDFNTADVVISFTEIRDWHVDYGFFAALLFGMKRAVVGPAGRHLGADQRRVKGLPGTDGVPLEKVEEHHPVRCHRWHGSPRRYSGLVVSRDRDRRPAFSGISTRAGAGAVTWGACFLFELDHVDVTSRGAVKALIDALARLPERSWSNWTLRGKDGALVTRVTTGRDVELPVAALAAVAEWRPVLPTPVVVARIQPRPSWLPDIIAYPTIEECVKINAVLDGDNEERTRHG